MIGFILRLPFHILGLLQIMTPWYWIVQLIHWKFISENDLFSERFWTVNFLFGLWEVILILGLTVYLYSFKPEFISSLF